jgi:hypothetical protein
VDSAHLNPPLRACVNELFQRWRGSQHPLFGTLAAAPEAVMRDPIFLARFYARYQACMHVTRAAVYFAPGLDSPAMRQRKIAIILGQLRANAGASGASVQCVTDHLRCHNYQCIMESVRFGLSTMCVASVLKALLIIELVIVVSLLSRLLIGPPHTMI